MGEGRSADSIPEPLSGEVLKQGVVDAFQLLENSENNFLLPCRKSGACEATGTSEGSCLHSASESTTLEDGTDKLVPEPEEDISEVLVNVAEDLTEGPNQSSEVVDIPNPSLTQEVVCYDRRRSSRVRKSKALKTFSSSSSFLMKMARTRQTTRKSTRGLPHPIHHPQKVPDQVEHEQPEDLPEFMIVEDDDDDYYSYYEGG